MSPFCQFLFTIITLLSHAASPRLRLPTSHNTTQNTTHHMQCTAAQRVLWKHACAPIPSYGFWVKLPEFTLEITQFADQPCGRNSSAVLAQRELTLQTRKQTCHRVPEWMQCLSPPSGSLRVDCETDRNRSTSAASVRGLCSVAGKS